MKYFARAPAIFLHEINGITKKHMYIIVSKHLQSSVDFEERLGCSCYQSIPVKTSSFTFITD